MSEKFVVYEEKIETAVLIAVSTQMQNREKTEEYLDELAFLVETAGGVPVARFIQPLDHPNSVTYLGTGKLEEVRQYIKAENITMAVFDDELTPTQLRNIEKELECKILDRTNLILDIFAKNARTAHAKTQVELAQYQYMLPRLTHLWTHLERQKGGIGLRGPGEKEIETDRRIIRDKITSLKERLKEIDMQKTVQRKNRGQLVRVALVGYTNVGKRDVLVKVFRRNRSKGVCHFNRHFGRLTFSGNGSRIIKVLSTDRRLLAQFTKVIFEKAKNRLTNI